MGVNIMDKNKIKTIVIIILSILLIYKCFRFEYMFGYCMDGNGNGIELNIKTLTPYDDYYNYICYDGKYEHKFVNSILIYNPFTNYCDDIIFRIDFENKNVSRETLSDEIILKYGHFY